jgi:cell division protein FtsL
VNRAYAYRRPVANAFLVRERDRRRLRELVLVLAALLPLGLGLLTYTWVHTEVIATGYRIRELENLLEAEGRRLERLRLEASYLASPAVVEERAARELGMERPRVERVLFWEELR